MEGGDHDHEMKDSGRLWRRNKEAGAVEKPPAAFLVKTHMVVENPSTNEVISWNGDGTGFVVWHPPEFARDILPTLFKHSNFSSFVRQLNTYGFRKVATSRWEFCNDFFRKGERQLLRKIHRRKAWTMAAPPLSQSTAEAKIQHSKCSNKDQRSSATLPLSENGSESLVNENKRLKKENGVLSSELTSMKRKLKELVDLVAAYTMNSSLEKKDENEDEDELGLGPKLFGVRLEVQTGEKAQRKRKREEAGERSLISVLLSQSCK